MERGSFELMKKMNQKVILKLIYKEKSISRAQIAEITGLSPATVSNIVKEMLEMDLIKETTRGESRGGRKPVLLEINPGGAYFIGLEWGIAEIRGVIMDLNRNIVVEVEEEVQSHRLESFIEITSGMVNRFKDSIAVEKVYGMGVGVHGMVDPIRGYSLFAPHFHWKDLALKEKLEKEFELPILIDNDVRVMALAEKWNGHDNFLFINTGSGIGAAILLDGKLYYGRDYSAGEFGHMTIVRNGPLCSCGNKGCLEALISTDSLVRRYDSGIPENATHHQLHRGWIQLVNDARDEKKEALELIEEIAEYLSLGLSNLVNLLNPDEIILGGEFLEATDLLLPQLKNEVREKSLQIPGRKLKIAVTEFAEWVGAIGGATMVLQQL
ncbi:MAG: ROK family transcriptional regulator, partial [Halanaerobiales bacterium]